MTISHYIVAAIGLGYLIVGMQQYAAGQTGQSIMWWGYSISQIGLWLNLAK